MNKFLLAAIIGSSMLMSACFQSEKPMDDKVMPKKDAMETEKMMEKEDVKVNGEVKDDMMDDGAMMINDGEMMVEKDLEVEAEVAPQGAN